MKHQPRAPRFFRGQKLGATALNRLSDAANAANAAAVGAVGFNPGFLPHTTVRLAIQSFGAPGFIMCTLPGQTGNGSARIWTVELPPVYTEPSRNFGGSIGNVTYVYTDHNTRTATGSTTETQYLTPPLILDEVIEARDENSVFRMLGDGRMWAVDPPAP